MCRRNGCGRGLPARVNDPLCAREGTNFTQMRASASYALFTNNHPRADDLRCMASELMKAI